jgi:hypothetical protein
MFDRFALWWTRTSLLWCIGLTIVCIAAPIKTFQVSFEAVTSDDLWVALATDLDVGASVEAQAEQLMTLVPVEELKSLQPMLGEKRTGEIVDEAERIRDGVSNEVGTATSRSINKVIGQSVPRFLMGDDLTGNQLQQDLALDLRPVREDLEAWLTRSGHLVVDAIAEAAQAQIKSFMAPAISEVAAGHEAAGLQARLIALEQSFEVVAEVMQSVGGIVQTLQAVGIVEDKESAEAAVRLTETIEQLAALGVSAVNQGRAVLDEASQDSEEPDWGMVLDRVTAAMLEQVTQSAKTQADVFAKNLTQAIIGNGTYALPGSARRLMVEQLRPAQLVLAPTVTAGAAFAAVGLAGLWGLCLMMILVAGRVQRAALWTGSTGLLVGAMAMAISSSIAAMAEASAAGLGAVGQAVAQAGVFISKMLSWAWSVLRFFLDIEDTQFHAVDGWTTQDVLSSATYGVLQARLFDRLDGWGFTLMLISALALGLWLVLQGTELLIRRRTPGSPGSLTAVLQQPGGMRIEDPLLMCIPKRGEAIEGATPHASPSRVLVRGVVVDLSWLMLLCLLTFSGIGLSTLMVLGTLGGGAVVVTTSAGITAMCIMPAFLILRMCFSEGRTLCGALAGERLVDHTSTSRPERLRSLLALIPWLAAIGLGLFIICLTDSAVLGLGSALGLLLLAEIAVAVLTGGTQSLGAKLMDRRCTLQGTQITAANRIRAIRLITHIGTIWSILWGLGWALFFGMGLFALATGIAGAVFWFQARDGSPSQLQVRTLARLRLGHWLSLDPIGVGLGLATLWLLNSEDASAHFASTALPLIEEE